jgi:chromosome segregation ATPase
MNRIAKILMATAIAVLPVACKDSTRKEADRAAENVKAQREDVKEDVKDLNGAIKDQVKETTETATKEQKDVNAKTAALRENVNELNAAEGDFSVRRLERATQLRTVHSVIASQPMLINVMSGVTALTDKARASLAEKLQVFQMRVDEAGNAITAIQAADAADFEKLNDAAAKALDRLKDARNAAWEALNDGDRIEAS